MILELQTWLFALIGVVFIVAGTALFKAEAVLRVKPNACIFVTYKALCWFVSAWFYLIPRAVEDKRPTFAFTWWAVLAAQFYFFGTVLCFGAIHRIGIAQYAALHNGTESTSIFFIGW